MAGPSPPNGKRKGRGKGGRGGGRSKAVKKGAASKSKSAVASGRASSSLSKLEQYDGSSSEDESEGESYSSEEDAPRKKARAAPRKKGARATKKAVAIKSGEDDAMEVEVGGDAAASDEEGGQDEGMWILGGANTETVLCKTEGKRKCPRCDECKVLAWCVFWELLNENKEVLARWRACLDCMAVEFGSEENEKCDGGWDLEGSKLKVLKAAVKAAMLQHGTTPENRALREAQFPDIPELSPGELAIVNAVSPGKTLISSYSPNSLQNRLQRKGGYDGLGLKALTRSCRTYGLSIRPQQTSFLTGQLKNHFAGNEKAIYGKGLLSASEFAQQQYNKGANYFAHRDAAVVKARGGMALHDIVIKAFRDLGRIMDKRMGFRRVPDRLQFSYLMLLANKCGIFKADQPDASSMVKRLSEMGLIVCLHDEDGSRINNAISRIDWDRTAFMVKHVSIEGIWANTPPDTGKPLREVFHPMTDEEIRSLDEDPSEMRGDMLRA